MPEVFGKYQMLTRIASGGMAEVWLARSSSIGGFEKLLAIKRMHANISRNQNFVSMFIDEAKLTVSLSHPNIVQIFDFGRVDDDYFMAMEYVEGFDLSAIAKRARKLERPLPIDVCVYIMRAVFDGLAYAHNRTDRYGRPAGIIHRDVSPQNVLVAFDGHVKVNDFGIARARSNADGKEKAEVFGKLAYLAPEQTRGEGVSPATDIWAAGVIFHELLSNQRLFLRETDPQTMLAVGADPVPSLKTFVPEIPPELDALVMSILQRAPKDRPASAEIVSRSLAEIAARHYATTTEHRLRDVIAELWDNDLPRLALIDEREPTKNAPKREDQTVSAGAATLDEIAASSAKRSPASNGGARSQMAFARIAEALEAEENEVESTAVRATPGEVATCVAALKMRFLADPNLWRLVDIGQVYLTSDMRSRALGAFKVAAAKFAQRGLLIQAAAIYRDLIDGDESLAEEIGRLALLKGLPDDELLAELDTDRTTDLTEFRDLFVSFQEPVEIIAEAPILSSANPAQLTEMVRAMVLSRLTMGQTIVREGERGDSFYLIGRGRVLVSTTNFEGQKIYITSLSDGDCFGEHGFFTGLPRTATVEALEDVTVLELSKEVLNRLVQEHPSVRESMRRFYKERIAESLLAKSALFGHLSTTARKMLAERFTFETYAATDLIIREGDRSDAFYAIKTGRVLVYGGGDATGVPLAELGPGEIFGETAAVDGTERTASVRAMTDCEILRLEAKELNAILENNVEIRLLMDAKIEERSERRRRKLGDSS